MSISSRELRLLFVCRWRRRKRSRMSFRAREHYTIVDVNDIGYLPGYIDSSERLRSESCVRYRSQTRRPSTLPQAHTKSLVRLIVYVVHSRTYPADTSTKFQTASKSPGSSSRPALIGRPWVSKLVKMLSLPVIPKGCGPTRPCLGLPRLRNDAFTSLIQLKTQTVNVCSANCLGNPLPVER